MIDLLESRAQIGLAARVNQAVGSQLIRYFFVALLALAGDALALSITARLTLLNLHWCVAIGFGVGVAINYFLSIKIVFIKRQLKENQSLEAIIFVVIGILGLLLTESIVYMGYKKLQWNLEFTKFLAAGVTFSFNFLARKFLLFK